MSDSDTTQELINMAGDGEKKPGCCRRHPLACGITLIVLGFVSLAVVGTAIGLRPYLDKTFKDTVENSVMLVPGSVGLKQFEKSTAPQYTKFYFFNVTNSNDVVNKGAHPKVEQCGPYTYREWRSKHNLTWNENETIVHYALNTTYTWEPSMSSGRQESDKIITLNIPFYVLLLKLEAFEKSGTIPSFLESAFDSLVERVLKLFRSATGESGLFMTIEMQKLLFGYNDPLLKEAKKLLEDFPLKSVKKLAKSINPFFGLENRTEVEPGNAVYTGKDDINDIGQYIQWEGNFEIGGWGTPDARMINGTGGYLFPPGLGRHENITMFISELFRSGYFTFLKDTKIHDIAVYRFTLPSEELVSANQDPGFYPNGPDGVLNLTAVFEENAPLFASKPHFLGANPGYGANVTGLQPNSKLHDSFLDVEPITGAVIRAAKRIQFNMRLTKYDKAEELKNMMPELMMPLFWASVEGQLTNSEATEFKKTVYGAKYGMEAGVWGGVGLGGLVFVVTGMCFAGLVVQQCRTRHRRQSREPQEEADENTALLYTTN